MRLMFLVACCLPACAFVESAVDTVATELEIPAAEDDAHLAEAVARTLQRYAHFTIWDYLAGRITQGVVTLTGRVTPDRDKAGEIFERVAKIKGVQDINLEIRRQSSSRRDRDLRIIIDQRVRRHPTFSQFAILPDPPFRILVDRAVVTLVGSVRGDVEKPVILLQRIVNIGNDQKPHERSRTLKEPCSLSDRKGRSHFLGKLTRIDADLPVNDEAARNRDIKLSSVQTHSTISEWPARDQV